MSEKQPFYHKGLRFECQKDCSKCCGGAPGYVWLHKDDVKRISNFLNLTEDEFIDQYTKLVDQRLSLIDVESDNWNCIMLKEGRCSIYNVRPMQCRTFPFWYQNLESDYYWEETVEECPGIGKGRLYSQPEIESIALGDETIDSIK